MPQKTKLLIKGLWTNPNSFSEVPEGSLSVADNLVIDRESIAESRRGFTQYGNPLTTPKKLFNFLDHLVAHDGTTLKYDSDNAGNWQSYTGSFDVPETGRQIAGTQAKQNLYLATNVGTVKIDKIDGTPQEAGAPQGLDLNLALSGSSGFMATGTQVGYRIVWGYVDNNNNLVLGAPSVGVTIANSSGGSRDVDLNFTIPSGLTTSWFYQVYRSLGSLSASIPPDDELQLVIQTNLTSGNISAGTISITDSLPYDLLGAALYTNSTQEGILQANDRPPYALDITTFNDFMIYANTKRRHFLILTMKATPAADKTVTINSVVFTAKASETIASGQFKTFSTGTPETDIPNTLASLVKVINRYSTNTSTYAYIIDNTSILIEARAYGNSFQATSNSSTTFQQTLPVTSTNAAGRNQIDCSKSGQVEAVPRTQNYQIGRADKDILRVIALRDAAIILKEDGAFRVTGFDPANLLIEPIDTTIELLAPETAAKLDNQVYCCTTQGIAAISISGVTWPGRAIEAELKKIIVLSNFENLAWSASYEGDRKFILGVPNAPTSPEITYLFVYNYATAAWTRWPLKWRHAIESERDKKLYAIRLTDGQVLKERKMLTIDDYADDEYDVNILSVAGAVAQLDEGEAEPLQAGMTVIQGGTKVLITLVDTLLDQITVDKADALEVDDATVYTPIENTLRWSEEYANSPGLMKHWQVLTLLFEKTRFSSVTARVSTEASVGFHSTILHPKSQGRWGRFPWGRLPWGRGIGLPQALPTYFPRECARSLWANIEVKAKEAFSAFSLVGATIDAEVHAVSRFR